MHTSARLVSGVAVAAIGAYLSLSLALYADADDAPGGVVIGVLLMFAAVGLGMGIALRDAGKPSPAGDPPRS